MKQRWVFLGGDAAWKPLRRNTQTCAEGRAVVLKEKRRKKEKGRYFVSCKYWVITPLKPPHSTHQTRKLTHPTRIILHTIIWLWLIFDSFQDLHSLNLKNGKFRISTLPPHHPTILPSPHPTILPSYHPTPISPFIQTWLRWVQRTNSSFRG